MSNSDILPPLKYQNFFGNQIFKTLSTKAKDDNIIIFAPWSTQVLVVLLHEYASANTESELEKAFTFDDTNGFPKYHESVSSFVSSVKCINFREQYNILTNGQHRLKESLEEELSHRYNTTVLIKGCSSNNHQGNVLFLENVVSFKAKWDCKFNHAYDGEFFVSDDQPIQVPMMNVTQYFNYKRNEQLNIKVVEVPFASKKISMLLLVPLDGCKLEDLETQLLTIEFSKLVENLERKFISLHLPKMKIEKVINIGVILQELGVSSLFIKNKCDLSGMVTEESESPYCGEIVQLITLEIDEDGYPLPPPPKGPTGRCFCRTVRDTVKAIRPFLMYVKTNEVPPRIIFQSRISQPLL